LRLCSALICGSLSTTSCTRLTRLAAIASISACCARPIPRPTLHVLVYLSWFGGLCPGAFCSGTLRSEWVRPIVFPSCSHLYGRCYLVLVVLVRSGGLPRPYLFYLLPSIPGFPPWRLPPLVQVCCSLCCPLGWSRCFHRVYLISALSAQPRVWFSFLLSYLVSFLPPRAACCGVM
jgi:hypothetical protein